MRKFILPKGPFVFCAVVVLAAIGLQFFANHEVRGGRVVYHGACTKVRFVEGDAGINVRMVLLCGGKEYRTSDADAIISYLEHPGPLMCAAQRGGSADCQPRKN